MDSPSRRLGLKWKIAGMYTAVMLVLGVCAVAAVYQLTGDALRDQLDRRSLAIANNFSDAAAGPMAGGNTLALNVLARKYTLLDGVAYAFVDDGKGAILAQTFGSFPQEVQPASSAVAGREPQRRSLRWAGRTVHETAVPVLEGQLGSVHVGFWADLLQDEIQRALVPIVAVIAIIPFVGALLSVLVAHWIVRPIVGLTQIAEKVTMGDL